MVNNAKNKKLFGLIGRNISYSFSRQYFQEKFATLNLDHYQYLNFDIQSLQEFSGVIKQHENRLVGLNVTIPYKQEILPFLDEIDIKASKIGAVNTIKITKEGKKIGYNTDEYGFRKSLEPLLEKHHKKALVLGTGGASKAVVFALTQLNIAYKMVSRTPKEEMLLYSQIDEKLLQEYFVIINCTPLGTHPNINECVQIPYNFLTTNHLLYDLIYNPKETQFLKNGTKKGATTKNGLEMLQLQAEKSWELWHK